MSIFDDNENKAFDARTMIAIVLMVLVITAGMTVQNKFFPRDPLPTAEPARTTQPAVAPVAAETGTPAATEARASTGSLATAPLPGIELPTAERTHTISTDIYEAVFTNRGGELVSLKLKEHKDDLGLVDLLLPGDREPQGFSLAFGGPGSVPLDTLMAATMPGENMIEFSAAFAGASEGESYIVRKRYEFKPREYMFKLSITVENSQPAALSVGDGTYAYTLAFGPQIGPRYSHLPKNADWRKIIVFEGSKRKEIRPKNGSQTFATDTKWSALAGKYFAIIAIPETTRYDSTFTNQAVDGYPVTTSMAFSRPPFTASSQTDVFYIYAGPKSSKVLTRYDDPQENAWRRVGDQIEDVIEGGNMLGWLEAILKWMLTFFYGLVGNFGVAIILVTILVRIVMFPLTFKGSMSTARMAELQPRIQELQAKHKGNPTKLNQEMAEFYKKEGYNPLSGCLPMLIQFPIFIAMYALFNNHFDLRGASFIPGWINDLSLPEAVYTFPTINLVIWRVSAIRILPILYVASQLLYGRFMQQPTSGGQSAGQMKFMMYGMPIMFFFILYDMPSGLLVYWIAANILTIGQQVVINKVIHKKKLAAAALAPQAPQNSKIVPIKGGKGGGKGRK
ncbi:MAG: membrane protein insertase YidC [Clostridia bacterium]